jgi:hypothetical protein
MAIRLGVVLIALMCSGCIQQIALNSISTILDNGFAVLNEEQDLDIAEKSIASNLKLLESVIRSDPENAKLLIMASQGYASYALAFVEDDSVERARIFYLRGRDFGLSALASNKQFTAAIKGSPDDLREALSTMGNEDVPAVFWTAIGWGSYISWSLDNLEALADLPKVEEMMKFVREKDSTYYYGGATFFLATLYGSRPKMLGGDPALSQKLFEQCLKISDGKFLMVYVYYARSCAVQLQDVELFRRCLDAVESASLDVLPEARLSNAVAKRKAADLRAREEELF